MCGIAGFISLDAENVPLSADEQVLSALHHRGPDSQGIYTFSTGKLYHTRLAVIDLSANAHQPFTDTTGRYTIVLNGEIFNYLELAAELKQSGIALRSESDTEVLLNVFIREKEKCLPKLNGFFSFAVYDAHANEIWLVSDRYGIKPLYFLQENNNLFFASELRALKYLKPALQIDKRTLPLYFHLNYLPHPYSIFKQVEKMKPGTCLHFSSKGTTAYTYYQLSSKKSLPGTTYETSVKALRELLSTSVKDRLVSDVPLGCFLSGGVDSSIVTALAAKEKTDLRTFSVAFSDYPYFNETEHALAVSRMHHTKHTLITLDKENMLQALSEVLENLDEPFADSSAVAVYALSKEVKKHVSVALSGDGADELLGGYNKHQALYRSLHPGITERMLQLLAPLLSNFIGSRNSAWGNRFRQMHKFSNGLSLPLSERYWQWAGNNELAKDLFALDFFSIGDEKAFHEQVKAEIIERINLQADMNSILIADQQVVLPGDMLTKVDRMSMAHGLEVRTPFLDYRFVDFVNTLPATYKVNKHYRKKILVDAFSDILPEQVYKRAKKGFEIPLHLWLKNELREMLEEEWLNEKLIREEGVFSVSAIQHLKKKLFTTQPGNAASVAWAVVVFRCWFQKNKPA